MHRKIFQIIWFGLFPVMPSSDSHQAWTGFYASRNVLKGVARQASSKLHAAETMFTRYRVNFPDGPVAKEWALDKLKALRWAVSEVTWQNTKLSVKVLLLFPNLCKNRVKNKWSSVILISGAASWWHHWHRVPQSDWHVPAAPHTSHDGSGGAPGCTLPASPQPWPPRKPRCQLLQGRFAQKMLK